MHSTSYEGPASDHFDGTTFSNVEAIPNYSPAEFLKMRIFASYHSWPDWVASEYGPKPQPSVTSGIRYVVVNHSTVLIQVRGINLLTDPQWSDRASPFSWVGPKRVCNPGMRFEDLPPIHAVLISHNHYDHMDLPTMERLRDRFDPTFYVGLGNKAFLKSHGFDKVEEMDWWDQRDLVPLKIHFVPAQHFSARGPFDRNHTLWGGFMIDYGGEAIFFAGDTGYGSIFREMYNRLPKVRLAFIPIGAYQPEWFMGPVHLSPTGAVKVHVDLHSEQSVGIHFGTFHLTAEAIDQPVLGLQKALKDENIVQDTFFAPEFGKTYSLD